MKYVAQLIASLAVSVVAGPALADNHMGVDTAAGAPGNQVLIRAGYYPTETSYTISGGRLRLDGDIAMYDVVDQLSQAGPYSGWYAGQELLITSDFYASTGHLNGGNFMWELASITPLSGGPGVGSWGDFDGLGEFTPSALTSAGTRVGRPGKLALVERAQRWRRSRQQYGRGHADRPVSLFRGIAPSAAIHRGSSWRMSPTRLKARFHYRRRHCAGARGPPRRRLQRSRS